jgi:hypothetical protein
MPDLPLHWRSFLVPKDGHALTECEDAVAGDLKPGRFAIADGAAESYASGDWARRLVAAFTKTGPIDNWLVAPRKAWNREASGSASSWYAEEKLIGGGHATFLGISIQVVDGDPSWQAIAVGDACLFLMSRGALVSSFPLQHSSEFSATPAFVTSHKTEPEWKKQRGLLCPGDTLLLATDALSKCLFESAESGSFAGRGLVDMTDVDFAFWVAAARSTGKLRNDDVALGVIELKES